MRLRPQEQRRLLLEQRRPPLLHVLLQALQPLFGLPKVADDEVKIYILDIPQRIVFAHVRNGGIVKRAHHVSQGINRAEMRDVGRIFEGILADGSDVDIFNGRVHQLLGIAQRCEPVQPVVRHLRNANMGLARVRACRVPRLGQNAEKRSLAYLGKSNDSSFHKYTSMIAGESRTFDGAYPGIADYRARSLETR